MCVRMPARHRDRSSKNLRTFWLFTQPLKLQRSRNIENTAVFAALLLLLLEAAAVVVVVVVVVAGAYLGLGRLGGTSEGAASKL